MPRDGALRRRSGARRCGPDDRSVDVYVHKLRAKLGDALPEWRFIHTHFGFGYRLEPERFHTLFTRRPHGRNRPASLHARLDQSHEERKRITGSAALARRRWCSRSASPPAAATAARPAAAVEQRARAVASRRHASTAPAPRSRSPSTRSGPPASRTSRHDRQLPGHRLGRRHRAVHGRHRRLRRHRLGDDRRGDRGGQEEGRPGPRPDACSAPSPCPTTSRASTRASSSTARRSPTSSSARSRSGTTRRSRSSTRASKLPARDITVCHRSDESGTTKLFTTFLAAYSPGVEERPGRRQDGQVADRHRRQGQRRRRRLRQAERRRRRLRRAGLRARRTTSRPPT